MIDILQLHDHIVTKLHDRRDIMTVYMIKVLPLISMYKSIVHKPKIVYFLTKAPDIESNDGLNDIVTQVLCIMKSTLINAHIHIPLPSHEIEYQVSCVFCRENSFTILDRDTYVCDTCSSEYTHKVFETVHSLTATMGGQECPTRKHAYDRIQHFKSVIQQFQGKKLTNIPDDLFDDIRGELKTICLTDDTSNDPVVKYRHVSKQHILTLLQELRYKYERYYDDIHYIHYVITERPRHDISHLEDVLMKNFNLLSNTYDKYSAVTTQLTRKNFINKQLVLFQLLQKHMYHCDINEFNFVKTYECMETHERICSDVFNILGWKYIPVASPMRLM
jgi:hypothetical protein